MARECTRFLVEFMTRRLAERSTLRIALAGGSSPVPVYEKLARAEGVDWDRVHVFFSDERMVPPDHDASNYRMAAESLLRKVPLPETNVHPVDTTQPDAEEAARIYERMIRRHFDVSEPRIPAFDVVLLGMGSDGHTASLFPGSPVTEERSRLVVPVDGKTGNPPVDRVTFTLQLINAAESVVFIVAGKDKSPIMDSILSGRGNRYPAAQVKPRSGALWFFAP